MTKEDIARLRALAAKATPGPWKHEQGNPPYWWRLLYYGPARYGKYWEGWEGSEWDLLGHYDKANQIEQYAEPDAAFIAAARSALPAALDEIDRLRAALTALADRGCHHDTNPTTSLRRGDPRLADAYLEWIAGMDKFVREFARRALAGGQ